MARRIHDGLAGYLAIRKITNLEPDRNGSIALGIDSVATIHCRALPQGELLLDARIAPLPEGTTERDEFLFKAMHYSAARMRDHAETLVMGQNENSLRLQRRIEADASRVETETYLEEFVDAIEDWRECLGRR
jgi:hypothetical protein